MHNMDIPSLCSLITLSWLKDNIVTASNISTALDKSFSEFLLSKSFWDFPVVQWLRICLQKQGHGAPPRFGKIPHTEEHLSQWTATTELTCPPACVVL